MMDGYIVYQGIARDSTKYFNELHLTCPPRTNPSDFFMKVLTINYPKTAEDEDKIARLTNSYNQKLIPLINEEASKSKFNEIDLKQ